jgi:hypothetical protein
MSAPRPNSNQRTSLLDLINRVPGPVCANCVWFFVPRDKVSATLLPQRPVGTIIVQKLYQLYDTNCTNMVSKKLHKLTLRISVVFVFKAL